MSTIALSETPLRTRESQAMRCRRASRVCFCEPMRGFERKRNRQTTTVGAKRQASLSGWRNYPILAPCSVNSTRSTRISIKCKPVERRSPTRTWFDTSEIVMRLVWDLRGICVGNRRNTHESARWALLGGMMRISLTILLRFVIIWDLGRKLRHRHQDQQQEEQQGRKHTEQTVRQETHEKVPFTPTPSTLLISSNQSRRSEL